jgi:uncharacterized protein (DUF433 family)
MLDRVIMRACSIIDGLAITSEKSLMWNRRPDCSPESMKIEEAAGWPTAAPVLRRHLDFDNEEDDETYHQPMNYQDYITIEPGKCSGKPCIRGLRITVYDAFDYLASGMSEDEILDDFPDLTREDIRACLAFAADRERRLMTIPA